jgi:hypothetical protein
MEVRERPYEKPGSHQAAFFACSAAMSSGP